MLAYLIHAKMVVHASSMNIQAHSIVRVQQVLLVVRVIFVSFSHPRTSFKHSLESKIILAAGLLTTTTTNPCLPNPCLNGGTCQPNGAGSFTCACPMGFSGYCCESRKRF